MTSSVILLLTVGGTPFYEEKRKKMLNFEELGYDKLGIWKGYNYTDLISNTAGMDFSHMD